MNEDEKKHERTLSYRRQPRVPMVDVLTLPSADVLTERIIDRHPLTAPAEMSVRDAIATMDEAGANCIFAVASAETETPQYLGSLADRTLVRIVALGGDLAATTLGEAIASQSNSQVAPIHEAEIASLETILGLFHQSRCNTLAVIDDCDKLVGAIALTNLLEAIVELGGNTSEASSREQTLLEQRLQTTEARLRVLVESLQDIVLVVEAEGTQLEVIPTSPAIVSDPNADPIGETIERFFGEAATDEFVRPVREALTTQKIVRFEYQLEAGGGELWYDASISPLSERSALWVARNISQRKRAEVEVIKALEKEQELNELKSNFIAMASHEFRTPLSTIKSSAQLLQRYDWERSEQLPYLEQIQSSVQHMTALMEDVLFLGKTEAGQLQFQPEPLDPIAFCRKLIFQMQIATHNRHSLIFNCAIAESTKQIQLDKKLLQQILSNLLNNAIAYSPEGSLVRLSLHLDTNQIVFEVQDSGMGIPPEDRHHLFESFYRARNVFHIAGTGLGLTIVKQCVALHGGEIEYNSELGVGTTFRVSLPLL